MWQLELGDEIIARLQEKSIDFPWINAKLLESPKFERFREYFSDDELWPDSNEFEALCGEVRSKGRFVLRNLETNTIYENITLNHVGEFVWFRYS
jgi:hypothetical protein